MVDLKKVSFTFFLCSPQVSVCTWWENLDRVLAHSCRVSDCRIQTHLFGLGRHGRSLHNLSVSCQVKSQRHTFVMQNWLAFQHCHFSKYLYIYGWTGWKYCPNINDSLRMYFKDFSHTFTFSLVPWCWHLWLWVKYINNSWMNFH